MAAGQPTPTAWEKFKSEGGWLALGISLLLGTAGVTQLITLLFESPSLELEDAVQFWEVFKVTLPLAVGATIFFALLFAETLNSGPIMLLAGLAALVVGASIGTALGSTGINLDDAALYAHGGSPPANAAAIWWYLTAYYQLYGYAYFISAIGLGAFFGRWAAWLYKEKLR